MALKLKVVVPPHPLIGHWLTMLRNESTPPPLFGKGLEELGKWLTYEALRDWLPFREENVKTPQGTTKGTVIEAGIPLLVIPSLPAGLELWNGAREVLPNAHLCLGGTPTKIEEKAGILIYLDLITDGSDLVQILEMLSNQGVEAKRIRIITPLAANEGLKVIGEKFEDLTIYCACIDPDLSEQKDIIPGMGNPSLRLNTRITGSI